MAYQSIQIYYFESHYLRFFFFSNLMMCVYPLKRFSRFWLESLHDRIKCSVIFETNNVSTDGLDRQSRHLIIKQNTNLLPCSVPNCVNGIQENMTLNKKDIYVYLKIIDQWPWWKNERQRGFTFGPLSWN